MKRINLVCVGKIKDFLLPAVNEYSTRLRKFCALTVTELPEARTDCVKREGEEILKRLSGYVILCDLKGELLTSEGLAQKMDRLFLSAPALTFVIGGSEGVSEEVKKRADAKISFGGFTYPHQLMRVILLEQIYRAFGIINNTPYHK